jgi:U6 snRNA-associated Sm-like protein LSm7
MAAQTANIHRKKESLLSLEKYLSKAIVVRCTEGRELHGTLKGFDSNLNLVMANTVEHLRDPTAKECPFLRADGSPVTRPLGAVVVRGATVVVVLPSDGTASIENPFL